MTIRNYISILNEADFTLNSFMHRYDSAKRMAERGATEGERQAGQSAVDRLRQRANDEMANLSPPEQTALKKILGISEKTKKRKSANNDEPIDFYPDKIVKNLVSKDNLYLQLRWGCPDSGYYICKGDKKILFPFTHKGREDAKMIEHFNDFVETIKNLGIS